MGKKNFNKIYLKACQELQTERPSIKLSYFCDDYDPKKNYAGIILYNHRGSFKWKHRRGSPADGCNCRFLYVYMKSTDDWSGEDFQRAGEGKVHDKMFKEMFGVSFRSHRSCCGGFAVMKGKRKYSSIWLNDQSSKKTKLKWESDGNKNLSYEEKMIVDLAIDTWVEQGKDNITQLPKWMHEKLLRDL